MTRREKQRQERAEREQQQRGKPTTTMPIVRKQRSRSERHEDAWVRRYGWWTDGELERREHDQDQ